MDTSATLYLQYDQFCDLLGGASWDEASARWTFTGSTVESESMALQGANRFSSPGQFLFQENSRHPLEVLWLKWNLFSHLCVQVQHFHTQYQRPFLDLYPAGRKVVVPEFTSTFLPIRWFFSVEALHEKEAALPYQSHSLPADLQSRLYQPSVDRQNIYRCPVMQRNPLGTEQAVTALIRVSELIQEQEQTEEGVRGILEIQIISENMRASEYSDLDVFRLHLAIPGTNDMLYVWASKSASLERGLLLKGFTDRMPLAIWEQLQKTRNHVFPKSILFLYKTYHVPCDLYSLGMILFRTLLLHDEQNMSDLYEAIYDLLQGLEPMMQGLNPSDHKVRSARFLSKLAEKGNLFSKKAVLYRSEDRKKDVNAIGDVIWSSVLLLAFRMISWIPEWSYCAHHGDYALQTPHHIMEKVSRDVDHIAMWIRAELLGSPQRNQEILEVCHQVRQEYV